MTRSDVDTVKSYISRIRSIASTNDRSLDARIASIVKLYRGLETYPERRDFLAALEQMLRQEQTETRSLAVEICVGFFDFRDVVPL